MDYNYKETRAFSNDLVRLKKGNLKLSQKIDDALATIRSEPKQSVDGYKLKGTLEGQRAYKVDQDIRIRYAICRECRGLKARLNCPDCSEISELDSIMMVSMGTHKYVLGKG